MRRTVTAALVPLALLLAGVTTPALGAGVDPGAWAVAGNATTSPAATSGAAVPGAVLGAGRAEHRAYHERRLLGRSVEGRPIFAFRKGVRGADRVVLILGQMHGDERAGVASARHVRDRLRITRRADVWVIPTINPDGHAANSRYNARGVDLNRNFPTNWEPGSTAGTGPVSEPETRAVLRFLKQVDPTFVASLHQPFGVIGRSDKNMRYVRRLSEELRLPIQRVQVGDCEGRDCPPTPTLTSWFNSRRDGFCVTIELPRTTTPRYRTVVVGNGLLRATYAAR